MTSKTLGKEIKEAVPKLLDMARELTWNDIPDTCKFILTETRNSTENFHVQRLLMIKENDKKMPIPFSEVMPTLQNLYDNLYDINLHVYRVKKHFTVVDIRYYTKSSLDQEYRQ
jgi:hypothetical protein